MDEGAAITISKIPSAGAGRLKVKATTNPDTHIEAIDRANTWHSNGVYLAREKGTSPANTPSPEHAMRYLDIDTQIELANIAA